MSDSEYGYLCLTRRTDQMIRIGDNVRLKVISVDGYNVRIGIKAPKDIVILREEVYQRGLDARTEEEGAYHNKVDSACSALNFIINEIFGRQGPSLNYAPHPDGNREFLEDVNDESLENFEYDDGLDEIEEGK